MTQNDCQNLIKKWKELKEKLRNHSRVDGVIVDEESSIEQKLKETCWNMLNAQEKSDLDSERWRTEVRSKES